MGGERKSTGRKRITSFRLQKPKDLLLVVSFSLFLDHEAIKNIFIFSPGNAELYFYAFMNI